MTAQEVTALVLVAGAFLWIVYDLVAYVRAGNDATISRVLLYTNARYPWFGIVLAFVFGVLFGHLFLPQHVSP